jgi:hypothetical protein
MTRRVGIRTRLAAVATAVVVLATYGAVNVLAVHDLQFELDGNQTPDASSTPPFDWTSFFNAAGQESPVLPDASRPGFTDSGFSKDFTRKASGAYSTNDQTTFATGSKDTLSISPGWQCNFDHNVSDKVDILNAYAVAYTAPATIPGHVTAGDQILYFALERFSNDGDANVAFWFLQGDVNCVSPGGNTAFTGNHQDGDILVVSSFTNGGVVSNIDAYRWNGDDTTGSLGTTPVAHGVDCKNPATAGGDATCATVNDASNGTLDPPWDTANKSGTSTNEVTEFFEGGLNLTAKGLGGKCFNTFIADTRSSQSLTATLFDYARGVLGECGIAVTTTPSTGSNGTYVLGSGVTLTDTADVSGTSGGGSAPTPTGNVSFFLCGPGATTCVSPSGTAVPGNPKTLGACSPAVTGHACATSGDAKSLITAVGTYCFRAVYDPLTDPNYQGKGGSFDGANECFTVTDTSSITTDQKWLPNDSATVTTAGGTAVSGTVTFTLYENGTCTDDPNKTEPTFPDSSAPFETNNTSVYTSTQTISWKATFVSDNGVGTSTSSCETSTVTINNNHP